MIPAFAQPARFILPVSHERRLMSHSIFCKGFCAGLCRGCDALILQNAVCAVCGRRALAGATAIESKGSDKGQSIVSDDGTQIGHYTVLEELGSGGLLSCRDQMGKKKSVLVTVKILISLVGGNQDYV